MGRIRDGNDVRPPRNLIDLVKKAQDAAIRRQERDHDPLDRAVPLLPSDALKTGLRALSKQRVEDTLLAEAGAEAFLVDKFRGSKAEHNRETIGELLGVEGAVLDGQISFLKGIGFLEATVATATYKVPMLYRDGLGITQGKAFEASGGPQDEEEDS